MEVVAQLVRALDCGSRGRGFEPHHPPSLKLLLAEVFFMYQFFLVVIDKLYFNFCGDAPFIIWHICSSKLHLV